jgi:hypothetical protein
MRKGRCSQQHGAASVLLPTDYARTDAIGNACAIASSEKTWVDKATALSVGSLALSWELGGLVEIVYHICVGKVSKQLGNKMVWGLGPRGPPNPKEPRAASL